MDFELAALFYAMGRRLARHMPALGLASSLGASALVACAPARTVDPPRSVVVQPPPPLLPTPPLQPLPPSREPPDQAAPPIGDPTSLSAWQARHRAQLQAPDRGRSELVVLGDSLAEGWCASRSFQKQWGKRRPLNLGLALDQTRQVLWRIENGSLRGVSARVVIVALGMDTLGAGYSADETARGVRAVVERVRAELPRAAVLLLGVLPAGELDSDPRRAAIATTNAALQRMAEPERVVVADVGNMFLDEQGQLSESVMSDFVHPTPLGYDALTMSASLLAESLFRSAKTR